MFYAVYKCSRLACSKLLPQWKDFEELTKERFCVYISSTAHCAMVLPIVLKIVLSRGSVLPLSDPYIGTINADTINGWSPVCSLVFNISAAYFLWDGWVVVGREHIQWEFLFHHLACFVAYIVVTQPFLQYHAVRLLLFELSTPLLNARWWMIFLGWDKTKPGAFNVVQSAFAAVFIAARVLYGVPASIIAFQDTYAALQDGRLVHPRSALFLTVANVGLTALNLLWAHKLVSKMASEIKSLLSNDSKKKKLN